jgi:hypothetical protein
MIARAAAAVLMIGAAAACAPAKSDVPVVLVPIAMDMDCGFHASIDYRRTREERENPRACALPDAATLARRCAVHDVVAAPGYVPDEEDETGEVRNPTPLPDYRVDDLVCGFDGEGRNRATCRFALTVPGGTPRQTESDLYKQADDPRTANVFDKEIRGKTDQFALRHKSYGRITPLTFEQGVMWQLDDDCTPDVSPAS